ncbi:methylene-tetrahydromethanopterin reductase [Rhodococcoides trifolii]|uniref:Methylene-tetrahydromethanopterin reductase n=1 Tax=Rhodococcoides trifolii TaxID=908250 RepID=A0A917CSA6_9NOCA|nr:methylene-tetrahydromethanopterin reductase [Rhodococcus trifolii]
MDRSRTRAGFDDATGVTGTVERAVWAEQAGYQRFWVAEHHAVPGIASGAPAVLLAAIGGRTDRIRLGSGGVMLPNHQPLVVAEQFSMLSALYPGRIDLGVGRSLGFTPPVRRALRRERDEPDTFEADIDELRHYLLGTADVTARPAIAAPPIFVLATGHGLNVAARLGLPVVVGGPALRDADRLATYRREFRASEFNPVPHVMVSVDAYVADSEEQARRLAVPEAWAIARSRQTGEFPPLEDIAELPSDAPPRVREAVEKSVASAVAGTPEQVGRSLERLVDHTAADEVISSTSTFDRARLRASDELLAQVVSRL